MNPEDTQLFNNYKASNPTANVGTSSPTQTNPNDWYSGVKAGTYKGIAQDSQQPGLLQGAKQDIKQRAENLKPSIEKLGNGNFSNVPELALNVAGQGAGAIGDIVGRGLSAIAPKTTKAVSDLGGQLVNKFENTSVGKDVTDLASQMQLKHPQLARDISSAGSLAMNAPVVAGVANLAETGLKTGAKALEGAKNTIKEIPNTLKGAKEAIKPSVTPGEATGEIVQGETADKPMAQRTIQALKNTEGIKTHAQLSKAIDEQIIKPGLKQVDAEFAKDPTPHKIQDFTQTVGEGDSSVTVNYVQDAIDQLKDYYTKTGDVQGISDMKALESKVNTKGLTHGDINNLAREHGSALSGYNPNGQLANGLAKQTAENTRIGLKTTARNGLESPEAKLLDKQVSEAISTKKMIDERVEKVNQESQQHRKVGELPKKFGTAVKAVGYPIDTLSRWTGVSGEKTAFTPSELEGRLPGNLKTIRNSIHPEDQKIMTDFIDAVRIGKEVPKSLDIDVENLRSHFGLLDKGQKRLADDFEKLLSLKPKK